VALISRAYHGKRFPESVFQSVYECPDAASIISGGILNHMTPLRLAEIVLLVDDLDRSLAFYRDTLGLTVISPAGAPATFLRLGPVTSGVPQQIVLVPRPSGTHASATGKFDRDVHHIGLEVAPEVFEAERERLAASGLTVRGGEHPFLPIQAFYIDDPDGNEIEIVTTSS
jgi:catechol 2,3-dioxygenase-like lactoylglutathione lyase family enzyme